MYTSCVGPLESVVADVTGGSVSSRPLSTPINQCANHLSTVWEYALPGGVPWPCQRLPKYMRAKTELVSAWYACQPSTCFTFQSPQLLATSTGIVTLGRSFR